MNKICVYAIAKNESANVVRWYNSMKEADHIIVLDTGSTDNTVELLKELGVEVHQKKYEDFRFDVARNDSLALVSEEYNIKVCTDLDEIFDQGWAEILRQNWDDEKPRALYTYIWSHTNDGNPGLVFIYNKIHGKGVHWDGAVHEHLVDDIHNLRTFDLEKSINLTNKIILNHYPDETKNRDYYLELAEKRIEEDPSDYYNYILLGNEYKARGLPFKAIQIYKRCITLFPQQQSALELAGILFSLGECYSETKQAEKAFISYTQGIIYCPFYRDNYYGLAILYMENRLYDLAIGIIKQAFETTVRQYFWMEDSFTWSYGLYDVLALCYFYKKEYKEAIEYGAKALSYDKENEILNRNFNMYISALKNEQV